MTINEKIHIIRIDKGMSQAELAYKTKCSIDDIKRFETNGIGVCGLDLLKIINAFEISTDDFKSYV